MTHESTARNILGDHAAAKSDPWRIAMHRTRDAVETWHMPGYCVDLVNSNTVHVYREGDRSTITR